MTDIHPPKLSKLPFLFGDLLLLGVAAWLVWQGPASTALGIWHGVLIAACVGLAAWLGVLPFLQEHRAAVKFAESGQLVDALTQLRNLQTINEQIRLATGQWQTVQESANKSVAAANEIAQRITAEAQAFGEFMQKANDAEKHNLRLELEKQRRAEGEWLQTVIRLLDHVYALQQAGARSGQRALVEQLDHFQHACRDAVRRVGLVSLTAAPEAPFDEKQHQLPEGVQPEPDAVIEQTVATGYTFQGRLLRLPMVTLKAPTPPVMPEPAEPQLSLEQPS